MTRLVLVNIGNTNTVTARADGLRIGRATVRPTASVTATEARTAVAAACAGKRPDAAVLAAVVPVAETRWNAALRAAGLPILRVDGRLDPGLPVAVRRRDRLGADRLANVCAAFARFGAPVIVVDAGTATTFDAIARDRGYVGGAIVPGPALLLDALARGTAQLPRLAPRGGRLPRAGRDTESAMRLGARAGYAGLVRGVLDHLKHDPDMADARICLTGGAAPTVARDLRATGVGPVPVLPRLTLEGLARLHALNANAVSERPGRTGASR